MMSDRNNAKRYVFGAALASAAIGGVPGLLQKARAQQVTNAGFTFESSFSTYSYSSQTKTTTGGMTVTTGTGTVNGGSGNGLFGPLLAESGSGSAYGQHAATGTQYSFSTGNGSAKAFSSNDWTVAGDYYKFSVPTTGIQNIVISFDTTGSASGPKDFNLIALDGTSSTIVGSYTVALLTFASSTSQTAAGITFSMSSITSLNNNPNASFELAHLGDNVGVNSAAVGTAGTDRVDNVLVFGDPITSTPEPSTIALAGIGAGGLLLRRRSKRASSPV